MNSPLPSLTREGEIRDNNIAPKELEFYE